MDAKERARLRALRETIPAGDVTPCCERAGEDGHHSSWALGATPHGAAIRAWVAGPLDLLALARAALPALLDDADAADARIAKAERERDEARDRVAVLETVLREIAGSLRSHERMDPRWCLHCGVEWGTQHVATCPAGRALRVLDGRDAR